MEPKRLRGQKLPNIISWLDSIDRETGLPKETVAEIWESSKPRLTEIGKKFGIIICFGTGIPEDDDTNTEMHKLWQNYNGEVTKENFEDIIKPFGEKKI